jgi:hypothetical protein
MAELTCITDGEGWIPQSCSECLRGVTQTPLGNPALCQSCTFTERNEDGALCAVFATERCEVCGDRLRFGHAYEARGEYAERVMVCPSDDCRHVAMCGMESPL